MILGRKTRPCPFCGCIPKDHPNSSWKATYYWCDHEEGCYFDKHILIPKNSKVSAWNRRPEAPESECRDCEICDEQDGCEPTPEGGYMPHPHGDPDMDATETLKAAPEAPESDSHTYNIRAISKGDGNSFEVSNNNVWALCDRIDRLKADLKTAQADINRLYDKVEEEHENYWRQKRIAGGLRTENANLKAENERLKETNRIQKNDVQMKIGIIKDVEAAHYQTFTTLKTAQATIERVRQTATAWVGTIDKGDACAIEILTALKGKE